MLQEREFEEMLAARFTAVYLDFEVLQTQVAHFCFSLFAEKCRCSYTMRDEIVTY